jgi:Tfp pilus assembly protein PilO
MSGNRIWVLGTAVLSIALAALGWFLGVSPRLDQISTAKAQKVTVDQQNETTRATIAVLKAEYENLDAVEAELDELRLSLPPSADYTGFLRELTAIAGGNSAKLTSFVPAAPTVFTPGDPEATAEAEAATPAEGEPVTIPDGTLISIPVALSASGAYTDLVEFIGDLQEGDRLYLASDVNITGGESEFTVAVNGYMFVEIDTSVTAASNAVNEPQPTQTPEPESTDTAADDPEPESTDTPTADPESTDAPSEDPEPSGTPAP